MIRLAILFFIGLAMIDMGINGNLGSVVGSLIAPANMVDDTPAGYWTS